MTESRALTIPRKSTLAIRPDLPTVVVEAPNGPFAWHEFFGARMQNPRTRAAYSLAIRKFFAWFDPKGIELKDLHPATVGEYFAERTKTSIPTKKLDLAALRALFDLMVVRHAMPLNPAASVRLERYQVMEGKTPEITVEQAKKLLARIRTEKEIDHRMVPDIVGLRDRAIIGVLIYTAARAGAVAKLRLKDFIHDGTLWTLRFAEKGGKSREIPVQHDKLEKYILEYLAAAKICDKSGDSPLFQSAERRTGRLTGNPITNVDICRMVKRRLKDAELPAHYSPHSFRVTTVTDLLSQGVPLEDVQYLAGHADPRTTRLYDRRQKRVTRNIVERISI
jgi:site-specific recombinase XerD